ncbi:MAG: dihydroxyacetone kinase transcriptional activator DhaS [Treponema sp.]|nr:dihydroxyacetone kinase transcriptional activator DhaS [Treponema sp.]
MSEALTTKRAIAASLKGLMGSAPLAKISVRDIVGDCGLNRQTFYYHFRDKYELVNWIYESEAMASIAALKDYEHWTEGIVRIFAYLLENRAFYVNALNAPGRNSFDGYLFDATKQLIRGVADEVAEGLAAGEADRAFVSDFYAFAFVGMAVRWIKSGMGEPPEEITRKIADLVEGSLRRALEKWAAPARSGSAPRGSAPTESVKAGPARLLGIGPGAADSFGRRGGES